MPLYDYQCRACSKVTEVRHGFKEAYDGTCPECGSDQLARVFNPAGIVFKGSGFYVTDSRKAPASESSSSSSSTSDSAKPSAPAAGSDSGGKKSEASAA
ncbi:MAG TPA: FmdB family zinc ribbon protein [Candidatus Elarobacter sp.]|jgi:putative FmdB family regulatory protein|nr:FmdB family zinc ribbon protein [Candidatus Elarobacter sp.]